MQRGNVCIAYVALQCEQLDAEIGCGKCLAHVCVPQQLEGVVLERSLQWTSIMMLMRCLNTVTLFLPI